MSGIVGILDLSAASGHATGAALEKMLAAISYRGPDGTATSLGPGRALGYLALNASPFLGEQPLTLEGCTLVGDIRLDDRDRLCRALGMALDTPDAALVLRAYLRWHVDCVDHLIGDFAFVIVAEDLVFCARDHLGVKPFYYSEWQGAFLFASEARAIQAVVHASVRDERIADFLVGFLEHSDHRSTFYEGVFRLPPASTLVLGPRGALERRFWNPETAPEPGQQDDQAYVEAFESQLATAIRDRQNPAGVTAMTLSGGVDSTTLVGVALATGISVRTFSQVAEPGQACTESAFIREAVASMKLDASLPGADEILATLPAVFAQLERLSEPFDYGMLQMMLLNLCAAAAGHRSLIDGVEGDMLYSLPSNYPAILYRNGQIGKGLREAYYAGRRRSYLTVPGALWSSVRQLGSPALLKQLRRGVTGNPYWRDLQDTLASDDFLRQTDTLARYEQLARQPAPQTVRQAHLQQILHPALAAAMERYDRVAAQSGIEARHPLMDKRLVELALAMPAGMKVRDGWSKYVLRKVSEGKIPASISWRQDKMENAWQLANRLLSFKEAEMKRVVSGATPSARYVRPARLADLEGGELIGLFGLVLWLGREQPH